MNTPRTRAGRRASAAALELSLGLVLIASAVLLLGASPGGGATTADGGADGGSDAGARTPPGPTARQTMVPEEPRPIGTRFDDDRALTKSARPIASYTLQARLDPVAHEVEGTGTIRLVNTTPFDLEEIYLHLYLNAFKNTRSTFLRSPFRRSRSDQSTTDWGFIDIRRLASERFGDRNLFDAARFAGPDGDETDARIPLPEPLRAGDAITFDVDWTSRLPGIVERTGHSGSFHFVGQWFPKLARLEPGGTWAHFAFHPHSEFYADFGTYDVTLDVPDHMVVGATGTRQSSHQKDGRRTERYQAESVHDFAWTAWDGFVESTRSVEGVAVRVLSPEGHASNVAATFAAVAHGLRFYGERFGRYPYPTLTVVHPPERASGAGGMEYPTLITTGGPWYAGHLSSFVERVTLHELGHQWFYGLVATNEHRSPFLDEGLTSFAESLAMDAVFGAGSGLSVDGLVVSGEAYMRASAAAAAHRDVIARPADAFATFRDVAALVYARPTTLFSTLVNLYGEELVVGALGRYARRYRYEHPAPRHLVAAVAEHVGDDAAKLLSSALFEGGWVDFVAAEVQSAPVRDAAGIFDGTDGRETRDTATTDEPESWRSRVLVYRHGTLVMPVDVDLVLESGTRVRRNWNGRTRWTTFEYVADERVVGALVDPEGRLPLDQNLLNNAVREIPASSARILERLTYWTALGLGGLGP